MIIKDINESAAIIEKATQNITFKLQEVIIIIYRIASNDYEKEVVDTGMVDLEEISKEDWIQERYDDYLSEEFLEE